ncbi:MAG TPA: hypothetical protein VFV94_06280, partial [Polyangiaceae bacterium]|nr:hypothetical protein [Polyangiaceae bacterium]
AAREAAERKEPVPAPAPVAEAEPAPVMVSVAPAVPPRVEPEREEPSGVHHRIAGPVRTPENRDALLQRLRERAQLRKGPELVEKTTAAAE